MSFSKSKSFTNAVMRPKMKLERTFHPVGQGAFFTERFHKDDKNVFNMVYDCGTDKCSQHLRNIINSVFPMINGQKQIINYLFISHFHEDHTNGIKYMLNQCEIQNIVIPAIQNKDILLCDYFHNIIRSESSDNNGNWLLEQIFSDSNTESLNYEGKSVNIIKSSDLASNIIQEQEWEYLPFCTESGQWKTFIDKFEKEFPTVYSAFNGHNFFVLKGLIAGNPKNFDKLKKMYKEYYKDPKKNDNYYSMAVLSKPKGEKDNIDLNCPFTKSVKTDNVQENVSAKDVMCLYTGDFPARDGNCLLNLKNYYKDFWNDFKTLQVPHHGSRYDNPEDLYDVSERYCVISYGSNNRFHHPSEKTLLTLHFQKEILVPVDETRIAYEQKYV